MAGEEAQQLELPEVVVKLEPDAPAATDVVVKTEVKDPAVSDLVNQYKELEAESEKRRVDKEAAEKRASAAAQDAAAARQEAATARTAATSSQLDTITTALSSAQAEVESAKKEFRAASEAGDFDAQATAMERMTDAKARVLRYDEAKADLETRKTAKPAAPIDPVEAYAANRSEPTANWLREHREFVIDPRKNQKLTAAHHDAMGEGFQPDTPEYFDHVEKFIGLKKADVVEKVVTEGDDVQRPGATKKPAVRQVAPVNGSARTGGAVATNEVRLSAREAEAANDGTHVWNYDDPSGQKKFRKGDPIGTQEFARRKQKLTQQGAYDRSYETQ